MDDDLKRAGDLERSTLIVNQDEELQISLWNMFALYAFGSPDGMDIYHVSDSFTMRGSDSKVSREKTLAKSKGLSRHTRAILNMIPVIVSRNFDGIMANASISGVKGKDDATTEKIQALVKKQFNKILSKTALSNLSVGNSYIFPKRKKDSKEIDFNVLYSNYVFLTHNPIDTEKLEKIEIKYSTTKTNGSPVEYYQKIDYEGIETRVADKTEPTFIVAEYKDVLPITHIKNREIPGEYYGRPCFSDIISDTDQICELMGFAMVVLKFYGAPKLKLMGTTEPPGGVKYDIEQTLNIPKDGDAKYLEFTSIPDFVESVIKIYSQIKMKAPEYDLSRVENGISTLSGFAIKLILSAFISKVKAEQKKIEVGLAEAFNYGLNLAENTKTFTDFGIEVDLGDVLPTNYAEILEAELKKKGQGWTTDELAMSRLGESNEDIEKIMGAQGEEMKKIAEEEIFSALNKKSGKKVYRGDDGNIFVEDDDGMKEVE